MSSSSRAIVVAVRRKREWDAIENIEIEDADDAKESVKRRRQQADEVLLAHIEKWDAFGEERANHKPNDNDKAEIANGSAEVRRKRVFTRVAQPMTADKPDTVSAFASSLRRNPARVGIASKNSAMASTNGNLSSVPLAKKLKEVNVINGVVVMEQQLAQDVEALRNYLPLMEEAGLDLPREVADMLSGNARADNGSSNSSEWVYDFYMQRECVEDGERIRTIDLDRMVSVSVPYSMNDLVYEDELRDVAEDDLVDVDSNDSNREDYYKNDYPDEESGDGDDDDGDDDEAKGWRGGKYGHDDDDSSSSSAVARVFRNTKCKKLLKKKNDDKSDDGDGDSADIDDDDDGDEEEEDAEMRVDSSVLKMLNIKLSGKRDKDGRYWGGISEQLYGKNAFKDRDIPGYVREIGDDDDDGDGEGNK